MVFIENANEAKQTPTTPPSPPADQGGDGDDRISGLFDDVLVRILGLADMDARELVRTGVLSRRWRGLWTRVPGLRFTSPRLELASAAPAGDVVARHVAFVNDVLARRARSAAQASIDSLKIPLSMLAECLHGQRRQLEPPVVEAAGAWIRYAVLHHVRRFHLDIRLPFPARPDLDDSDFMQKVQERLKKFMALASIDNEEQAEGDDEQLMMDSIIDDEDGEEDEEDELEDEEEEDGDQGDDDDDDDDEEEDIPVIDLDELPSSTKLETLDLRLSHARVRLPSTAVFVSVRKLTLEFVELAPGSGHLLARLSSSACCPSLQRLRIAHVRLRRGGTRELVLDAGELLQLSVDGMDGMRSLELRTPNLVRLEIRECDDLRSLAVSAPALEELTFQHNHNSTGVLAIHGEFPCVRRLETDLVTHLSDDDDINDANICLVRHCSSSATSLLVYLDVPSEIERCVDLIKDKIPRLPNVTSLEVNIHPIAERHSFGDGVAGLLTRFNNLEYLSLQLEDYGCKRDEYYSKDADGDSAVFTCNHADNWESNSSDISLGNLRVAGFRGMTGTGCELRFLQMVLAGATSLEMVTVSFSGNYNLQDSRMHYFLHTLLGDGHSYEWTWTWTPCP